MIKILQSRCDKFPWKYSERSLNIAEVIIN